MSGEDLLELICDDKLTLENGKALQVHINYQKESVGYFTPLMNAIFFRRNSAIRTLLILGANPTIQVKRGHRDGYYLFYRDGRYDEVRVNDVYDDVIDSFVVANEREVDLPGIHAELRKAESLPYLDSSR